MKLDFIKLNPGLLLALQDTEEVKTDSGILLEENTDDYVVHAKVVSSSSKLYKVDTNIIFHILDSESLRDGAKSYSLVHEDKVKGVYANPTEK